MATSVTVSPLDPFTPDLYERAWVSQPHPRIPLLATAHAKGVTVFSLTNFTAHSTLTGGHDRSVRSVAWKPGLPSHNLCLATASFDSNVALWRWDNTGGNNGAHEIRSHLVNDDNASAKEDDWEFTLVLEGHDSEVKSVAFSPSGQYIATCSRDKSIWIWEDVGASELDDEWETVEVLNEHDGDVKAVAWCPHTDREEPKGWHSADCLASASYDETVRIWRENGDGEWGCVAVLEGHKGTIWGIAWEPNPPDGQYPRLLTCSADATIRVWSLQEEEKAETSAYAHDQTRSRLGGIPNTMRTSIKDEWKCTAELPKIHTRDIYSITWSSKTGLVASTGSDGMLVVYREESVIRGETEAAAELEGEMPLAQTGMSKEWKVVAQVNNAHGPFEINHIVWCTRFDSKATRIGEEELLVTSGDDGVIRPWQVS